MNNNITDVYKLIVILALIAGVVYKIGELIIVGFKVVF
jgi:hypothetical protein